MLPLRRASENMAKKRGTDASSTRTSTEMVTSSRFECQQISSILGRNQGGKGVTRGAQFEQKRYA